MPDIPILCRSRWPGRPDREVLAAPGADLFSALRAGGMPIASSCTGRGACGRCVVSVLAGCAGEAEPEEQAVLDREGSSPDQRLACRVTPTAPGLILTTGYW